MTAKYVKLPEFKKNEKGRVSDLPVIFDFIDQTICEQSRAFCQPYADAENMTDVRKKPQISYLPFKCRV